MWYPDNDEKIEGARLQSFVNRSNEEKQIGNLHDCVYTCRCAKIWIFRYFSGGKSDLAVPLRLCMQIEIN